MSFNAGYKGKTTASTGMFYAPYMPAALSLRTEWRLKFAWLPVRCSISKKRIWLSRAFKEYITWREDMTFRTTGVDNWHNCDEHIIYLLKDQHGNCKETSRS